MTQLSNTTAIKIIRACAAPSITSEESLVVHPQHGRTWINEQMAWCVPGPDGTWIPHTMLGDSPPPYATHVPAGGFLSYWRGRP